MQEYNLFEIIGALTGGATADAFIIAIYSYNSFRKTEELKLAESIFRDIEELRKTKIPITNCTN